jgi:hypothetical protein
MKSGQNAQHKGHARTGNHEKDVVPQHLSFARRTLFVRRPHGARDAQLLSAYIGSMMFAQDSCKSGNNCLAGRRRELIVRQNLLTMPVGRLPGAAPCPRYFLPFLLRNYRYHGQLPKYSINQYSRTLKASPFLDKVLTATDPLSFTSLLGLPLRFHLDSLLYIVQP